MYTYDIPVPGPHIRSGKTPMKCIIHYKCNERILTHHCSCWWLLTNCIIHKHWDAHQPGGREHSLHCQWEEEKNMGRPCSPHVVLTHPRDQLTPYAHWLGHVTCISRGKERWSAGFIMRVAAFPLRGPWKAIGQQWDETTLYVICLSVCAYSCARIDHTWHCVYCIYIEILQRDDMCCSLWSKLCRITSHVGRGGV